MPSVPKWFGDALEKISSKYYHAITATEITYLNASLKQVRFEGDLGGCEFKAGQVIEFRVTDRDYRHYTPSYFDAQCRACEVIFYLHGKGVGSEWASGLEKGHQLKLIGPGGKLAYRDSFSTHVVFGDETAIGLMTCMERACRERQHRFIGLLEWEVANLNWDVERPAGTHVVAASLAEPAKAALEKLDELYGKAGYDAANTCFYLTGRAKSIQQVRNHLLSNGVPRKNITTEPYWAEGKKGL